MNKVEPGVCTECGKWTCSHVDDELEKIRAERDQLRAKLKAVADRASRFALDTELDCDCACYAQDFEQLAEMATIE